MPLNTLLMPSDYLTKLLLVLGYIKKNSWVEVWWNVAERRRVQNVEGGCSEMFLRPP